MNCEVCTTPLTSIRSTKKYCGVKCRVKAFRQRGGRHLLKRKSQKKVAKLSHAPFDMCPKHGGFYQSCGC